ncbi:MAG: zinc-ribbon domain-containing protein [Thaumarchaeota archaeon]|nr:zinc-ribbon domain-containing protein [Nitrososphaerota archaeon]
MPFCPNCGKEVPDGAAFCSSCGANLLAPASPIPQEKQVSKTMRRPIGVAVITILEGVAGILFILSGISILDIGSQIDAAILALGSIINVNIPLVGATMTATGLLLMSLGAISFILVWGLWIGKNWAWVVTLVISALGLIFNIFSLPAGMLGLIINAVILFYLTRRKVRVYFYRSNLS